MAGGGAELQRRPSSCCRGSGAGPAFQTIRVQDKTARPTHACVSLSSRVGLLGGVTVGFLQLRQSLEGLTAEVFSDAPQQLEQDAPEEGPGSTGHIFRFKDTVVLNLFALCGAGPHWTLLFQSSLLSAFSPTTFCSLFFSLYKNLTLSPSYFSMLCS